MIHQSSLEQIERENAVLQRERAAALREYIQQIAYDCEPAGHGGLNSELYIMIYLFYSSYGATTVLLAAYHTPPASL